MRIKRDRQTRPHRPRRAVRVGKEKQQLRIYTAWNGHIASLQFLPLLRSPNKGEGMKKKPWMPARKGESMKIQKIDFKKCAKWTHIEKLEIPLKCSGKVIIYDIIAEQVPYVLQQIMAVRKI
jgi:hypothetical protein